MKSRLPIYGFNWPWNLGGADAKFMDWLLVLHGV